MIENFSLYQTSRYTQIVSAFENAGKACYFEVQMGNEVAFYHFVKRDISSVVSSLNEGVYFDIITPFDYGGYFFTCKEIIPHFFEAFAQYCKEENIVSEFIRFCPMYNFDFETIKNYINVQKVNDLVYMDLEENFWNGYSKGRKSDIRQIQKKPYRVECIGVKDFYPLYQESMQRNKAHAYFDLNQDALQKLVDEAFARVFGIYVDETLVSSIMILDEATVSYYFLSATLDDFLKSHVNALLLHEIAIIVRNEGQKKFFLGGGRVGVYDFKRRFSQKTLPYFIGKKIHNQTIYDELVSLTKRQDNTFFPKYREKVI